MTFPWMSGRSNFDLCRNGLNWSNDFFSSPDKKFLHLYVVLNSHSEEEKKKLLKISYFWDNAFQLRYILFITMTFELSFIDRLSRRGVIWCFFSTEMVVCWRYVNLRWRGPCIEVWPGRLISGEVINHVGIFFFIFAVGVRIKLGW